MPKSRRPRTPIDDELVAILRAEMDRQGMMQKDLAAAAGMTQPQVSVRLSGRGSSIPVEQVARMCGALGLDPGATFEEAAKRASETKAHPEAPRTAGGARQQIDALGRQLAEAMWNGCDDWEFVTFAIDHMMDREDVTFWDPRKKQLALMVALADLAYVISRRYPVRDGFLLKPVMNPGEIIA